jgi:hypothetical protein
MSDTPRTDKNRFHSDIGGWVCYSSLCRQLERELHAANSIIRQQQLLDEENLRLQERIKRLEEENDAMRADLLLWNEKEVKL